jgi:hypothetical protein
MNASRYSLAAFVTGITIAMCFSGNMELVNNSMDGNPFSLVLLIVASVVIFSWPRAKLPVISGIPIGRFRRYVAATIDLLCVSYVYFSIIFSLTYLMEWIATGIWQWSWQREAFEFRDIISYLIFFAGFFGIYQYFWRHLVSGNPTVGQFVMGYRIIELEHPNLRKRLHSGIIALWLWPIALMRSYDKQRGITYWDKETNTRAVSTRAP